MTTTTDATVEIVKPAQLGPLNHVLIAISGVLGVAFLVGLFLIIYKEYTRCVAAKAINFKQKLNTRRKGISGQSIGPSASSESIATSEATSYIQLTETPTSYRGSSAWTPSPEARKNSVKDNPISDNITL